MNTLSLFAGVGGIDLGIERLGWRTVAHAEFDPKQKRRQYAADVFAARYPDSVPLGDITELTFAQNKAGLQGILRRDGDQVDVLWKEAQGTRIDVIVGGFP